MNLKLMLLFLLVISFAFAAMARMTPTLTIVNSAAQNATVKMVGPTSGYVEVSAGGSQTVAVLGGFYHLAVRYCGGSGGCNYSRTDDFLISENTRTTITLQSVGGNLGEHSIPKSEFEGQ